MIDFYELKDLCIDIIDCPHSTPKWLNEGIPVIRNYNISGGQLDLSKLSYVDEETYESRIKRAKPVENDIIISREAPMGEACLVPGNFKCCLGQRLVLLKVDKEKCNPHYLLYALLSPYVQTQIKRINQTGSIVSNLNIPDLKKLVIPYIKDNQNNIAQCLEVLNKKIFNNNKINKELESMAKTIYDYWFLQFEFPNEDGKPYKSSGGKMVWNEELKREIPEGWRVGRLNEFIMQDKGGDWGKATKEGKYTKKVTCLRGADFPSICGNAKLEAPERFINEKNTFKILKRGDLIIEISGGSPTQSTGRICYINTNVLKRFKNELITSNFCKAVNLIDEDFMYWFYNLWNKLYYSGVFFKYEGKTTGIKNLLFEMLCRDYPIIIPDVNLIKKYNHKIEKLFDVIQENLLENAELSSLRDFLLPLLMNGQIGFKEYT